MRFQGLLSSLTKYYDTKEKESLQQSEKVKWTIKTLYLNLLQVANSEETVGYSYPDVSDIIDYLANPRELEENPVKLSWFSIYYTILIQALNKLERTLKMWLQTNYHYCKVFKKFSLDANPIIFVDTNTMPYIYEQASGQLAEGILIKFYIRIQIPSESGIEKDLKFDFGIQTNSPYKALELEIQRAHTLLEKSLEEVTKNEQNRKEKK
jgi:hypothetical protein